MTRLSLKQGFFVSYESERKSQIFLTWLVPEKKSLELSLDLESPSVFRLAFNGENFDTFVVCRISRAILALILTLNFLEQGWRTTDLRVTN